MKKTTDYRNRIKALEYIDSRELTAHPGNWRDCGLSQVDALGQMSYNTDKRNAEAIHEYPPAWRLVRASHMSIVHRAPVACQVTGAFAMTAKDGKPCRNCGGSVWYKNGKCKHCADERSRKYYESHAEEIKINARTWKQENADRKKELDRRWQIENKERSNGHKQRWLRDNREKAKEAAKRWRQRNPDKKIAIEENRRARKQKAGGSFTAAEWRDLVQHYGNKCLNCGRVDVQLTVDHIVPISKGGGSDIENIQCLCLQCNSSKGDKTIDYRPDKGKGRWIQSKLLG